jgi:hypothetical protein
VAPLPFVVVEGAVALQVQGTGARRRAMHSTITHRNAFGRLAKFSIAVQ